MSNSFAFYTSMHSLCATLTSWALVVGADVSLSLVNGGGSCSLQADCGLPAANLASLREKTVSMTGKCVRGECECLGNYACSTCAIQEHLVRNATDPAKYYGNMAVPQMIVLALISLCCLSRRVHCLPYVWRVRPPILRPLQPANRREALLGGKLQEEQLHQRDRELPRRSYLCTWSVHGS